ncbi:MAG: hypothetical protein GY705_22045 [Bacteroidetes bacterium]|nr:hypothetical protein [Bacteroidota bacterium]
MGQFGVVIYKKGKESGTLDAEWSVTPNKYGTGKASGGPGIGFAGRYQIQYFHEDGSFDAELELENTQNGRTYELFWINNGVIRAKGIKCVFVLKNSKAYN